MGNTEEIALGENYVYDFPQDKRNMSSISNNEDGHITIKCGVECAI